MVRGHDHWQGAPSHICPFVDSTLALEDRLGVGDGEKKNQWWGVLQGHARAGGVLEPFPVRILWAKTIKSKESRIRMHTLK